MASKQAKKKYIKLILTPRESESNYTIVVLIENKSLEPCHFSDIHIFSIWYLSCLL